MEPKNLRDLAEGDTLMLAREIQERTSVSQVYVKVGETTVRHIETEKTLEVPSEELVYPFRPSHAARQS